jgi:DHA1 family inner membrane transport protein
VVLVLIALFAVGFTSQLLALPLQGLLMDLSPKAPSLGAALCHSALNTANANGAFRG